MSKLLKSLIWQVYQKIQAGKEPKVQGNIRTFWYRFVKVVLSHLPEKDQGKTDPYDVMPGAFTELVLDRRLFRYTDFDFTDENWENRRIGQKHPEVIVFTEKTGWIRFLREVHQAFGVSVLALGGALPRSNQRVQKEAAFTLPPQPTSPVLTRPPSQKSPGG